MNSHEYPWMPHGLVWLPEGSWEMPQVSQVWNKTAFEQPHPAD